MHENARPPVLYGSLNARQLSFVEVGESFVAPKEFAELCRSANHVLLGPRGSGKTMLMKMLTRSALDAWRERAGDGFVQPDFIGVYVSTDLLWARTLNQYWSAVPGDAAGAITARQLIQSIITLNILEALLSAVEMQSSRAVEKGAEAELVRDLADCWSIDVRSCSYYRLRQGLLRKITRISDWLELLVVEPSGDFLPKDSREWLVSDPIRLVGLGIEAACEHLAIERERRWALCFDELEIAPSWLREYVVSSLRSTDQRLVFKLSASPMQALATEDLFPNTSQQLHDYTIVRLWHAGIAEATVFSERLTRSFLQRNLTVNATPENVFRRSSFALADEENDAVYAPGSDFWRQVRELAQYDASLRAFLDEKGISLSALGHIEQKEKDEVLRKLKPIVMLRHAFTKADPKRRGELIRRTRKSTPLYTGAEAIYAVCDGNPRWLTGLLTEMLAHVKGDRVARSHQANVIRVAAQRFLALLSFMPDSTKEVHRKTLSLRSVLDAVGHYFENEMLGARVSLDPKGSFVVDSAAADELVDLVRMAAAQGAVVYIDAANIELNSSPRGKRFRLSFLLAPEYHLPFRVLDQIALSRCLGVTFRSRLHNETFEFEQAELFSSAEAR